MTGNNIEIQTLPTTFEVDGFIFDGPANRPLRQTSTTITTTTSTTTTVDPQFDQCVATCRVSCEIFFLFSFDHTYIIDISMISYLYIVIHSLS